MKTKSFLPLFLLISLIFIYSKSTYSKEKVVVVIIDGLRYSEGLGDPSHTYVPEMWKLAQKGSTISDFQNDGITYTSRAVPTIWCGAWTDIVDTTYNGKNTQYSTSPSIWEYIRKQKNLPAKKCSYILKYIKSLWLPSFDKDYGPAYWSKFYSSGNSDSDVFENTKTILKQDQPEFAVVYFADVDHAGHSDLWQYYLSSIETADMLVGHLWEELQNDPFYKDSTTMIVTNDHGRHDDQHGGFKGHGDGCQGCRHIQLLAIGPNIKKNYISNSSGVLPDVAVTAASILGVSCNRASGVVLNDMFLETGIEKLEQSTTNIEVKENYPDPFSTSTNIEIELHSSSDVNFEVYKLNGALVYTSYLKSLSAGVHKLEWDATSAIDKKVKAGIYFYKISSMKETYSGKMIFLGE